jgi:hypothetical protein
VRDDDNHVGLIKALKQIRSGAGEVMLEHETRLVRWQSERDTGDTLG